MDATIDEVTDQLPFLFHEFVVAIPPDSVPTASKPAYGYCVLAASSVAMRTSR
jgi:hypothetical protein